ncbi:MAG: hypothetical protein AAF610_06445 [Pseudomonadota bacterium]
MRVFLHSFSIWGGYLMPLTLFYFAKTDPGIGLATGTPVIIAALLAAIFYTSKTLPLFTEYMRVNPGIHFQYSEKDRSLVVQDANGRARAFRENDIKIILYVATRHTVNNRNGWMPWDPFGYVIATLADIGPIIITSVDVGIHEITRNHAPTKASGRFPNLRHRTNRVGDLFVGDNERRSEEGTSSANSKTTSDD